MPKRKRGGGSAGATFSLMDGGVDVLEGLVLHTDVISPEFEHELVSFVQTQCARGRRGELRKQAYIRASGKRSQGNKREALMFGGFFDFNRARPGKRGLVPPFPPLLTRLVEHLISHNFLPGNVRPDSCIINQYSAGDCIPPHVDHASYCRPISTLSLLGEEAMLVGTRFRTVKACTWVPTLGKSIALPRRSLLLLGGNAGNVSKHCISACAGRRISITLRKQPPPDWKPEASELVGKGTPSARLTGRTVEGADARPKKNKLLSGSAKKRKKMLKRTLQGGGAHQTASAGGGRDMSAEMGVPGRSANQAENVSESAALARAARDERRAEKQARRNARRLEKRTRAAAAAAGGA